MSDDDTIHVTKCLRQDLPSGSISMCETILTEGAARKLPEVVEQVQTSSESALLTQGGRPVARIIPVPNDKGTKDLIAFLRHWRTEHPEPDEQLREAAEPFNRRMLHGNEARFVNPTPGAALFVDGGYGPGLTTRPRKRMLPVR